MFLECRVLSLDEVFLLDKLHLLLVYQGPKLDHNNHHLLHLGDLGLLDGKLLLEECGLLGANTLRLNHSEGQAITLDIVRCDLDSFSGDGDW